MKRPSSPTPRAMRWRMGAALFLIVGGLTAAVAACSNQGEGERCEILNGDDDCKSDEGLSCYPADQLRDKTAERCCPRDRSKATHPACIAPTTVVGDAATPADTGPPPTQDASTPDADASPDADAGDAG
ncbi:MAG: hypothetical protein KF795_09285 [Labilithrix sp.]|nr:hypothetical protein [Labilithrix sp.]